MSRYKEDYLGEPPEKKQEPRPATRTAFLDPVVGGEKYKRFFADRDFHTGPGFYDRVVDGQSFIEKAGATTAQFLGTAVGTAIEGIGYDIAAVPGMSEIMYAFNLKGEYENAISSIGGDIREGVEEAFPLYTNSSFWAGVPQLGTTVGFLASALLAGKGVGAAVRGASTGLRGMRATQALGEALGATSTSRGIGNISAGLISRHAEGMMEASETYRSEYDKYLGLGFSEEKSSSLAKQAADEVYAKNWALVLTDVPQYLAIGKSINLFKGASPFLKGAGNVAFQMATEGFEEGYQYYIAEQSKLRLSKQMGLIPESRELDYLNDSEFWTSVGLGALGGGIFSAIGPAANKLTERFLPQEQKERLQAYRKEQEDFANNIMGDTAAFVGAIHTADELGDPKLSLAVRRQANIDKTLQALKLGHHDLHLNTLNQLSKASDEEVADLNKKMKDSPIDAETLREMVPTLIKDTENIIKRHDVNTGNYGNLFGTLITQNEALIGIYTEEATEAKKQYELLKATTPNTENLSTLANDYINAKQAVAVASETIEALNMLKDMSQEEEHQKRYDSLIQDIQEKTAKQEKLISDYESGKIEDLRTAEEKAQDKEIAEALLADTEAKKYKRAELGARSMVRMLQQQNTNYKNKDYQTKLKNKNYQRLIEEAKDLNELSAVEQDIKGFETEVPKSVAKLISNKKDQFQKEAELKEQQERSKAGEDSYIDPETGEEVVGVPRATLTFEETEETTEEPSGVQGDLPEGTTAADLGFDDHVSKKTDSPEVQRTPQVPTKNIPKEDLIRKLLEMQQEEKRLSNALSFAWYSTNDLFSDTADNSDFIRHIEDKLNAKKASLKDEGMTKAKVDRLLKDDQEYQLMDALTQYLENPENQKPGIELTMEIDESRLSVTQEKAFDQGKIPDNVGQLPVLVTLKKNGEVIKHNGVELRAYIHDDTWWNMSSSEHAQNSLEFLRIVKEQVATNYLKGQTTSGEITDASMGRVRDNIGFDAENSIRDVSEVNNVEEPKFYIVGENGEYLETTDTTTEDIKSKSRHPGAVFFKIIAPNGRIFPAWAKASNLTKEEAGLVFDLYKQPLGDLLSQQMQDKIQKSTDPRVARILEFLENPTNKDVIEFITYQTKEGNFRMYKTQNALVYGGKTVALGSLNKQDFIDWAVTKNRQIHLDKINTGEYNDYIIDTGIVTSSLPTDQAALVQPRIDVATVNRQEATKEAPQEGDDVIEQDPLYSLHYPSEPQDINVEEEIAWLKKNIPNIPRHIAEDYIRIRRNGVVASGMFSWGIQGIADGITLSKKASRGVGYHEGFHAVFNSYLTKSQRESILSQGTEEQLAERFRNYVLTDGKTEQVKDVATFFRKLFNWVKAILTGGMTIDRLFRRINTGYYAHKPFAPDSRQVQLYNQVARIGSVPGFTDQEVDSITDTLLHVVTNRKVIEEDDVKKIVSSATDDVQQLGNSQVYATAVAFITAKIQENQRLAQKDEAYSKFAENLKAIREDLLREARGESSGFLSNLRRKLQQFYVFLNEEETMIEEDERTGGLNIKEAYEVSAKERASINTKVFVAFVPKILRYEGNTPIYEYDPLTNLPKLHNISAMWNKLQMSLSDLRSVDGDTFELMYNRISYLSNHYPEIAWLKQRIDSLPREKRTEFTSAFSVTKQNHNQVIVNEKGVRIGSAVQGAPERRLRNSWHHNLKDLISASEIKKISGKIVEDKVTVNKTKAKELINKYEQVSKQVRAIPERKLTFANSVPVIGDLLRDSGIEISDNALGMFISEYSGDSFSNKVGRVLNDIAHIYKKGKATKYSLEDLIQNPNRFLVDEEYNTSINDEKIALRLAEAEALFRSDLSESTALGADAKKYHNYTQYNYITTLLAQIKQDPDLLQGYGVHHNQIINYLLAEDISVSDTRARKSRERINEFKFENIMNFKVGNKAFTYSELPPGDELAHRINLTLGGHGTFFTIADKKRFIGFTGIPMPNADKAGVIEDTLIGHFVDELRSMEKAYNEAFEGQLPEENHVLDYHYKMIDGEKVYTKNGKPVGDAFASTLFPSLNYGTVKANDFGLYDGNGKPITPAAKSSELSLFKNDDFRAYVRQQFDKLVDRQERTLIDNNIINKSGDRYTNIGINEAIWNSVENKRTLMNRFTLREISTMRDLATIFTSDPRYYKKFDNFVKRTTGSSATGVSMRVHDDVPATFDIAVVQDIIKPSEYYDEYVDYVSESFKQLGIKNHKQEAEKLLEPYKNVNQTDAQGYITLDRWRNIVSMSEGWTQRHQTAYDKLKTGRPLSAEESIVVQGIKGVHFELRGPRKVPTYLKYSQAVLFPALVNSNPRLKSIYDQMKSQGVDELVHISGVKAGAETVQDIYGEEFPTLHKITLSNHHYKIQQENPYKGFNNKTTVGTQLKKNIIVNLPKGDPRVNQVWDVEAAISNSRANSVNDRISTDGNFDPDKFRSLLLEVLEEKRVNFNILEALKEGTEIEAIAAYRVKLQEAFANYLTNKAITLSSFGAQEIMVSAASIGITDVKDYRKLGSDSGIKWFKPKESLDPPRIIERGNKKLIAPGQVLLPYTVIEKIPGHEDMTGEDLAKAIDPDVLRVIGYRIPNQNLSSTDSLEVVGILPKEAGDSIYAFVDITAKTGADFDIDKMYIIAPNVIYKDGRLITIPWLDETSELEDRYAEKWTRDWKQLHSVREISSQVELKYYEELQALKDAIIDRQSESWYYQTLKEVAEHYDAGNPDQYLGLDIFEIYDRLKGDDPPIIKKMLRDSLKRTPIMNVEFWEAVNALKAAKNITADIKKQMELLRANIEFEVYDIAQEQGIIPTMEEFAQENIYEQNTEKANENKRIEVYSEILLDPDNFRFSISPIDNTWLETEASRIEELSNLDKKLTDLEFYTSPRQFAIKRNLHSGQAGVGIIANQISDHPLAQQAELFFTNYYLGIGHRTEAGNTDFSQVYSEDKRVISETLSAIADVFLDAANKPELMERLNLTTETANMYSMLVKAGVSPLWITSFMTQPIIRDYVLTKEHRNNKLADKVKDPEKHVRTKWAKKTKHIPKAEILSEKVLNEELASPTKENQLDIFELYLEWEGKTKEFTDQVRFSKFDTGFGKDVIEAAYKSLNYNKVSDSGNIGNFDKKFENSMLGTLKANGVDYFLNKLSGVFFESMDTVSGDAGIINKLQLLVGRDFSVKEMRDVANHFYAYLSSNLESTISAEPQEIKDLFYGTNSVPSRLRRYKTDSSIKELPLIKFLNTRLDKNSPHFIVVDRNQTFDEIEKEIMYRNWEVILTHEDQDIREFGQDLVKYAYYTSGFMMNLHAIFDVIPNKWLRDNGFETYIKDTKSIVSKSEADHFTNFWMNQYYRNKWDSFVGNQPLIFDITDLEQNPKRQLRADDTVFSTNQVFEVDGTAEFVETELSSSNGIMYQPFLREGERLYRLVGVNSATNNPVYVATSKLGYNEGGHRIIEYYFDNSNPQSIIEDNNVELDPDMPILLNRLTPVGDHTFGKTQVSKEETLAEEAVTDETMEAEAAGEAETTIKPTVDTTAKWSNLKNQPVYTEQGVNTMRTSNKEAEHAHFGNPFSEAGYARTIKMPSVEEAIRAYKDWLLGENISDILGESFSQGNVERLSNTREQKEWILSQINQGKLDGATLLYDSKLAAREQGTHANALAEVVQVLRGEAETTQATQEEFNSIKTESGTSISKLMSLEEWNSLTTEEQERVKNCN